MTYPAQAIRSVRRAYSRDMARELVTIGTKDVRQGGYASEIVWKKNTPAHPERSGQARVNYKRYQRDSFVRLLTADILARMFLEDEVSA